MPVPASADGWVFVQGDGWKKYVHPRGAAEALRVMSLIVAEEQASPIEGAGYDGQLRRTLAAFHALELWAWACDLNPFDAAPYSAARLRLWPGLSELAWLPPGADAADPAATAYLWGDPLRSALYVEAVGVIGGTNETTGAPWSPGLAEDRANGRPWSLEEIWLPVDFALSDPSDPGSIAAVHSLLSVPDATGSADTSTSGTAGGSYDDPWRGWRWTEVRSGAGAAADYVHVYALAPLRSSWDLAFACIGDILSREPLENLRLACAWVAQRNAMVAVGAKHGDAAAVPSDIARVAAASAVEHQTVPSSVTTLQRVAPILGTLAAAAGATGAGLVVSIVLGIVSLLISAIGIAVGVNRDTWGRVSPSAAKQCWRANLGAVPPIPPTGPAPGFGAPVLGARGDLPPVPEGDFVPPPLDPFGTGETLPIGWNSRDLAALPPVVDVNAGGGGGGGGGGSGLGLLAAAVALGFFL